MNSKSNNKIGSNLKNANIPIIPVMSTKPEGIPMSNGNIKAKTFARPSKILENYKKQKLSIVENKTDIFTEKKESNILIIKKLFKTPFTRLP